MSAVKADWYQRKPGTKLLSYVIWEYACFYGVYVVRHALWENIKT